MAVAPLLQECVSPQELDVALTDTLALPHFLNSHYAIRNKRFHRFPEAEYRVFWSRNPDGHKIFFTSRVYRSQLNAVMLTITCTADLRLDVTHFKRALDQLTDACPEVFVEGLVVFTNDPLIAVVEEWYPRRFGPRSIVTYPAYLYFMTTEQQKRLRTEGASSLVLPPDYHFGELHVDTDAAVLAHTWQFSGPNEEVNFRAKLRNGPSAVIRVVGTGEPAAFEVTDAFGYMNHLFTFPEHRRRGLGSAVEKRLALAFMEDDRVPFKAIEVFNKESMGTTERSSYWTRWDLQEKPVRCAFLKTTEHIPS